MSSMESPLRVLHVCPELPTAEKPGSMAPTAPNPVIESNWIGDADSRHERDTKTQVSHCHPKDTQTSQKCGRHSFALWILWLALVDIDAYHAKSSRFSHVIHG